AARGIWHVLLTSFLLGRYTDKLLDFRLRIQLEDFLLAHPGFRKRHRIGERHGQLQVVAVQAFVAFLQAHLVAMRSTKMIKPRSFVKTGGVPGEATSLQ